MRIAVGRLDLDDALSDLQIEISKVPPPKS